jgi:hypothetical protein
MNSQAKTTAVVQGSREEIQAAFRTLVDKWRPSVRLAGLIAEDHGLTDRTCTAGFLRNIATGERFSIFNDFGPGSTTCHLDGAGVLAAAEAVRRDIAAGCDLVMLSKFGKLEAAGKGLVEAFKLVIEAHIPLLTSVSSTLNESWEMLAGRAFIVLPAEPNKIDKWWQTIHPFASSDDVLLHSS